MTRPDEALDETRPPAGGLGADPGQGAAWSPAPAASRSLAWIFLVLAGGCLVLAFAIVFFALESRISLVGDERTVIISALPGDDVKLRLSEKAPFEVTTPDRWNYNFEAPVPLEARLQRRGTLPIQINYRTWFGPRRTTWVAFDVDADQIRQFSMGMWSGGWVSAARFEGGDRWTIAAPNERCVRWRYGFDGAPPSIELPEGAREIRAPAGVQSLKMKAVLCQRAAPTCPITFYRDGRDPDLKCP